MNAEQYKQAITDAISAEIEAKEFYQKISERIKDSYLAQLFQEFSKEEQNHAKMLSALLEKGEIKASFFGGSADYTISETIQMPKVSENMNLKEAIGLAMKNEELAMKKYQRLAQGCDDPELKSVFLSLAAMEKDHKFKMENAFVDVAYPEVW
ncbi:MAG: ferritin family protein [Pseudomonadota bacterium]